MDRARRRLTAALVVALLSGWVMAGSELVLFEEFNRNTGMGEAFVHIEGDLYAWITFQDNDGSMTYTPGDTRLRVQYVRVQET